MGFQKCQIFVKIQTSRKSLNKHGFKSLEPVAYKSIKWKNIIILNGLKR